MKPAYKIEIDGNEIDLDGRLLSLTLTDQSAWKCDELSLVIDDHDNVIEIPQKGVKLRVWFGWHNNGVDELVDKGTFVIDEIGYNLNPRELSIVARSANFRAGLATIVNRSYIDTTLDQVIRRIASKHNLEPAISDYFSSVHIESLQQQNEGDGHFLTRLAQQFDAIFNIKDDKLLFVEAGKSTSVSGKELPTVTINASDCENFRYSESGRVSEYTGVKAKWMDTDLGELRWELAGDETKAQRLKRLCHGPAEAKQLANVEWTKIQRGVLRSDFKLVHGKPDLLTGTNVQFEGIKTKLDNHSWKVKKVVHTLDKGISATISVIRNTKL